MAVVVTLMVPASVDQRPLSSKRPSTTAVDTDCIHWRSTSWH